MPLKDIRIEGAYQHNLKGISLTIPRNKFIVITGVSGSGKSSLAFDTLYAEGHRRYVESLSSYARQFLDQLEKPDVDSIEGLSPAISIEQRTASATPRSTVGTVTEIYDFLRLLFTKIGVPHCPECGGRVRAQSVERIVEDVMELPRGTRLHITAPIVKGRKGVYRRELEEMREKGFVRARIDGRMVELGGFPALERNKRHDIEIVVDSLIMKENIEKRVKDSLEIALKMADGSAVVNVLGGEDRLYSKALACPVCGINLPELNPRNFSFNSSRGCCPDCRGLGIRREVDTRLLITDENLSVAEGAVRPWGKKPGLTKTLKAFLETAEYFDCGMDTKFGDLPEKLKDIFFYGAKGEIETPDGGKIKTGRKGIDGLVSQMNRRYNRTKSTRVRNRIESYMAEHVCSSCGGDRLRPESLAVKAGGRNIAEYVKMDIKSLCRALGEMEPAGREKELGKGILDEIINRSGFLLNVGLDYLTLDRRAATLSGGESQRIRLATQVGSRLRGILYVLDEPSIGLHRRDNLSLLATLRSMRDLGNTVIVVEHDEETILQADHVIDLGPGAGGEGGDLIVSGSPDDVKKAERSVTGAYLRGDRTIEIPERRKGNGAGSLRILGAAENNLKDIDVSFPLGLFTVVTGVSGSGKSTLVGEILYKAASRELHGSLDFPGAHREIEGLDKLKRVVFVDQSSIGRSSRSNPSTYTGVWTPIRELYALVPLSRMRGYGKSRFSFNVEGGRCPRCEGMGVVKIEMRLLPDLYVKCDACGGRRFDNETLEVKYKGVNIDGVLNMTVSEAAKFFENIPEIGTRLGHLEDIGLGYLKLGQPATTLSGGEAQRIKLSRELGKRETGNTLYLLDEPTIGLHFDDIKRLLDILLRLRDKGNTVIVIEHNYDIIKTADHILDLGPEGGEGGGLITAEGTPEEVSGIEGSYTGTYLKHILN